MSNQFLNKLKNVETSRANLENILASKDIDVGTFKSLPNLVAQVSKLKNPNWTENDEKWAGLVEREAPVDYYKGDDDWKDLIDINQIIEDYDTTSYQGAVFMLFRVSANPDDSWTSSYMSGFNAYKFSDNPSSTPTSAAHTWNDEKDIVAENGERFRWVLCFTSSRTCTGGWNAQYLVPEAVVYYKGQFRCCALLPYGSQYYLSSYSDEDSTSTNSSGVSGYTSNYYNTPKYFEIKEDVICDVVSGSYSGTYSVKTVIINGVVRSTIYMGKCPDLRYFVYTNPITPQMRVCLPRSIQATKDDRCYIKFNYPIQLRGTNISDGCRQDGFAVGNFLYNNYTDIYLNNINKLYYNNFCYNKNCNIKINNITSNSDPGNSYDGFAYNLNCNIDINEISSVTSYMFEYCKDSNIKIGTIWGGIGSFAFRYCNKMNTDIVCKSNSSTTYSIGYQPFWGTNIKVVDMSESRITTISNDGSDLVIDTNDRYTGRSCFVNNSSIEVIKLSKYITSVSDYCFSYMANLKEIDLGDSMTSLGQYCFYHCENLETIICPPTLQTIGNYCFRYCSSLKTIDLGQQITQLPQYCFSNCASLESISLPNSLTTFSPYCFEHCSSLKTITLPNELTILPQYCFQYCSSLETINTTGQITSIGALCFQYCSNLKNIFDFSNVISIGQDAFMACKSLQLKLNNLSGIISNDALKDTWGYIICDTDFDIVSNLYLWGAKWDNQGVLNFLYSLPTRDTQSSYTIYMGYSYPAQYTSTDTPTNSIYQYIKNKYVIEQDGKLVYTDQATEGAQTIQQYVNAKKWVLA